MKLSNKLKRIIIFPLTGMLISTLLFAQNPNYKFKSINQPDGLNNSTVQSIFEDSFGFIWLGTHHGVQRYDGKTYNNWEHTEFDSTSLSQNYINDFCEDVDKNIWISSRAGLNKYNRKTDKIERYHCHNKLTTKNGEPAFHAIVRDDSDSNVIWVTAIGYGLIKLNIKNDSATIYSPNFDKDWFYTWMLPYPGNPDKFLLGSPSLISFDKKTGKFEEIFKLEQNSEIPNNLINDAVLDPNNPNIIWLATGDIWGRGSLGGLIRYNLNTSSVTLFSPATRKEDMPDRHLMVVCFYDKDNLWIGTRNNGALLYRTKEDRFYTFKRNEYDKGSFATDMAVRSMLVDRSGTLWFGTWGDGISLLSPAAQKFSHYKHIPGKKNVLTDNYINTITEDKNKDVWIGTKAGGLTKFNPRQKTFEPYFQESGSSGQNPPEITYLFYDSHENLWVGTYNDALYRYSPHTGIKTHYKKGGSDKEVTQKRITAITEIKKGEILISTYGGGLNIYNYETDRFRHYIHDPEDSTSIPDNQVWLPISGDDGNYYFSGNSITGLIRFDPEVETFTYFPTLKNLATFMMPVKTSDGRIFVNDVSEGLKEIKLQDEISSHTIYDDKGNGFKNVEGILVDDENRLWLTTGNGLVEYDPDTKSVKRYDTDDGLQGSEFTRFAAFTSSTGEMYVGGTNGFSVFHPEEIKWSNYKPPIVFTDFKLYQESVAIGEESPLKQNILLMDELVLDHYQNDFSVSFAALDFSNPDKIEYKYILENHDEEWINAGHNGIASYTNMDPGEYTLKVLATNGDGVWINKAKSIRIIINPPWWQTTWAYFLYGLIFIAGVVMVDRIQRRRLKERERAQTREKELTQAKEIEKAYTTLKATQAQLIHSEKMASLGELTAGIAHEIQNPLNFVNNFSEVSVDLTDELDEEISSGNLDEVKDISADLKQNLEKIHIHGKRASSIVKGMLEHSRAGNGHKEPIDINALADEYLRLAYHGLRAKDKTFQADFKTDLDEDLPKINVVSQDIGRVLLNLINNAFYAVSERAKKETEGYSPEVTVRTKRLNGSVEILVKDNGGGIPDDILKKIFQPFFTTKPTGEGTGLGLSLAYDIIKKGHNGELKLENRQGKGVRFLIVLPTGT